MNTGVLVYLALVNSAFTAFFGFRLLRVAIVSRRLPDWLLTGFYITAGATYVALLGPRLLPLPEPWHGPLFQVYLFLLRVPTVCLCLFTWRVFRPGKWWAGAVAALFIAFNVYLYLDPRPTGEAAPGTLLYWLGWSSGILPPAWTAGEAFRYYGVAKRRMAIGLTDAVNVYRFLLFGLWACGTAGFSVVRSLSLFLETGNPVGDVARYVLPPMVSWLGICALWLLFFPPKWFRALVERRGTTLLRSRQEEMG